MKIKLGKLVVSVAALACFFALKPPAASADNFSYTFTGGASSVLAGTDFEVISFGGLLSFGPNPITPTSASDVFYMGVDKGPLLDVIFNSPTLFTLDAGSGSFDFSLSNSYNVGAVDPYALEEMPLSGVVVLATLDVADIGSSGGSPVPEPPSVILLAAGVVGLLILSRRKAQPFAG